ncbi:MAG: biphenyl 2,3-dioxygenase [Candidatus Marinimicrobia bacterium]|nr:biphenyl 2,3-dioxygenase [Candidatus Neomarinimicrobiota bacterium]|tara:strand:+ start:139 stop:825 length:687 start_codon:yes stop_codon:yes gene_type:complete
MDLFSVNNPNFIVNFSFWFATASMLACTAFFYVERNEVSAKWKTSITVAMLVTGIAFWHYLYMSKYFFETGQSPLVLRYVDWLITVPLQIVEFYLILAAVTVVSKSLFWKLLGSSLVMLVFGFLGEAELMSRIPAFAIGMLGWVGILYLIFFGEAANESTNSGSQAGQKAFKALRFIVLVGWAIYPIGYYLNSPGNDPSLTNIIYNFADLVNKAAFGLVIWSAAKSDS